MSKSDLIRLRHMLDATQKALRFCEGRQRADLDNDEMFSLAIVRLIEVLGEAANKVEPATQEQYPQIPWPLIIGARNRLIHGYDDVDFDIVWQIIMQDLPALSQHLQAAIEAEK